MKYLLNILLVLVLLVSVAPAASAQTGTKVFDPTALFVPDIVGVQLEFEAVATDASATTALPAYLPFNADLVNVEKVTQTGQGVYVAVLDTGLNI